MQGTKINLGTTRVSDQVKQTVNYEHLSTDIALVDWLDKIKADKLEAQTTGRKQRGVDLLNSLLVQSLDETTRTNMRFAVQELNSSTRLYRDHRFMRKRQLKDAMKLYQAEILLEAQRKGDPKLQCMRPVHIS
jgi:hypothetical protein